MTPILLEIEGFNSFLQKEKIDFKTLQSKGIFGIFGPTGSGKSSILDAIIFALYGKTPRGNTMNTYINMNKDTSKIRYIFHINGENNGTYEIQRRIRETKSGVSTTIKLINKDKDEVLADKITDFNNEIAKIIGLDYSEFTKTVVLPQGQFSDFLMAENTERKKILENVFSLNKYGESLDSKIRDEKRELEMQNKSIQDQIIKYEDINQDKIDEKEKNIIVLQEKIEKKEKDIHSSENLIQDIEKTLSIVNKIKEEKQKEQNLLLEKDKIENQKKTLEKLEKIGKISSEISSHLPLKNEINTLESNINSLEEKNSENNTKIKEISEKLAKLTIQKEQVPEKKSQIEKYTNAIECIKQKEKYSKEKNSISKKISKITSEKINFEKDINKFKENLQNTEKSQEEISEKIESLSKDPEKNRAIQNMYQLFNKKNENSSKIQSHSKEKLDLSQNLEKITEEGRKLSQIFKEKNDEIEKLKQIKIDDDYSLENFTKKSETYNKNIALHDKKDEIIINLQKNDEEIKTLRKNLEEYKKTLKEEELILENINLKIDKINLQEKIYSIQKSLKNGDICPVCNNIYEEKPNLNNQDTSITGLIENKESQEKKIKTINDKISSINLKIELLNSENEKHQKNLNEIPENILKMSKTSLIDDFTSYKKSYEEMQNKEEDKNKRIDALTKEKEQINTLIIEKREAYVKEKTHIDQLEKTSKELKDENITLEKEIITLEEKYQITDIESSYKLILENEKKISPLKIKLKDLTDEEKILKENINQISKSLEQITNNLNQLVISENTIKTKLDQIENQLSKFNFITEDIEISSLNEKIIELTNAIDDTNKKYENFTIEKDQHEKIALEIYKNLQQNVANLSSKKEIYQKDEKIIIKFMEENNYQNFETLLEFNEKIPNIPSLKDSISTYESSLRALYIAIKSYEKEIENKEIVKDEDLKEMKINLQEIKTSLGKDKETLGSYKNEKKTLEENLKTKNELLKNNEKLIQDLRTISNLQNVLKGRKFVQFLSKYNLDIICKMASKNLNKISQGKYDIIMDQNGEFLIRDYRNGGMLRKPSTLSGGEIFIVSMALALALSTKIQLKGKARLEFFFLDEGFGTLDQKTLEESLDVLSNLKNENLSIGIISHVEKVKDFMPIKLIVKPPTMGEGTKVEMKI